MVDMTLSERKSRDVLIDLRLVEAGEVSINGGWETNCGVAIFYGVVASHVPRFAGRIKFTLLTINVNKARFSANVMMTRVTVQFDNCHRTD